MIMLYSKYNCGACDSVMSYLIDNNLSFEMINVQDSPEAMDYIVSKGISGMPYVEVDGVGHTGFRPDVLSKIKGDK